MATNSTFVTINSLQIGVDKDYGLPPSQPGTDSSSEDNQVSTLGLRNASLFELCNSANDFSELEMIVPFLKLSLVTNLRAGSALRWPMSVCYYFNPTNQDPSNNLQIT